MITDSDLILFSTFSIFFISIFGFSLLTYSVLLRFSKTLGIRQPNDVVRWASTAKPALGGIMFYITFLISLICHALFFNSGEGIANSQTLGLLGTASLAFIMGLADDAYNTRPILKFIVQVLCGAALYVTGTAIEMFEADWINLSLTILWVVGIMNSINMLDNMDGITSMTSMFILLIAIAYIALHSLMLDVDFMIILGLIATLLAFLFYNWNPSKMYMGDTGSQFLGIILAVIGIRYFWNSTLMNGKSSEWQQIFVLLIAFLLPIVDTSIVFIKRIGRGQSPFVGGKDHTTHNLSYLGLSDSQVAMTFAGISALNLLTCYFLFRFVETWDTMIATIAMIYPISIFVAFYILCTRQRHFYTE